MQVSVELDVFSGRPNPAWALENDEAKHIAAQLKGLPLLASPAPEEALGYRGFVVTLGEQGTKQVFRVYAGAVVTGGAAVFSDTNKVEQQLLQMARRRGLTGLLDSLGMQ